MFLRLLVDTMMREKKRDYALYAVSLDHYYYVSKQSEEYRHMKEDPHNGHAGEDETSTVLAVAGEHVRMEHLDRNESHDDQGRTAHLAGTARCGFDWMGSYPNHYAGDGRFGTREKGEVLLDLLARRVAEIFRALRQDRAAETLKAEYFANAVHPPTRP